MATLKMTRVSPNYYIGKTTLADIRGNCPDPMRVDTSTEAQRRADHDLARAYAKRGDNQRQFNKQRIERAVAYARYISEVDSGKRLGGYPPITLWTDDTVSYHQEACEVVITGATILAANDGETQLAARYMMVKENSEWLDVPFAVTLTVESSKEAAMQTLHDLNHYATPVSEKETASLNIEGSLTKAINRGIVESGRVAKVTIKPRGERPTTQFLTTAMVLLHGGVGALYGRDGLNRTPNSLIKSANDQFNVIEEHDTDVVSRFIQAALSLPDQHLHGIDTGQMLALGAKYRETGHFYHPLTQRMIETLEAGLKNQRGGRRATIQARAMAFFEHMTLPM